MQRRPAREERYGAVAIVLHWTIAAAIVALAVTGWRMTAEGVPLAQKFALYQLHKSIGVTTLALVALRIAWRLAHSAPPLPQTMRPVERAAAAAAHGALYILMILLPLSGWALVSASPFNIPTVLFGILPWPHLPFFSEAADKPALEAVLKTAHHLLAYALLGLAALHGAAALRHQFILRDGGLWRMAPLPQLSSRSDNARKNP